MNVIVKRVRVVIVAVQPEISISFSHCVYLALVTQQAWRTDHIIVSGLLACTIFFSALSHKRHDYQGKLY